MIFSFRYFLVGGNRPLLGYIEAVSSLHARHRLMEFVDTGFAGIAQFRLISEVPSDSIPQKVRIFR